MKRKFIVVVALLAVALVALALYYFRPKRLIVVEDGVALWGIDPVTFEVKGPESAKEQIARLNTPEQIEERRRATLMVTNPQEYFRQFPKSPERLKAEADAASSFANPKTNEETLAAQSSEKRAEMEKVRQTIFRIERPKEAGQKRQNEEGPAGKP